MSTYLDGVEVPLPEGERLLWQGSPQFRSLAVHAFHARKIGLYFVALIVWTAIFDRGASASNGLIATITPLVLGGAAAVAFVVIVAKLSARTTLYAITDRRVVMKVGIALPIVLNIPLRVIESVGISQHSGGVGNLSLKLANKSRVAYAVLWPHARPWRVRYPEPLLRDLSNVALVGETLRLALTEVAIHEHVGAAAPITTVPSSPHRVAAVASAAVSA